MQGQTQHLLPSPPLTPIRDGQDTYPRIIDQRRTAPHHQLVTFALPGLRRAVVRIPEHVWLAGDHVACHWPLAALLARLSPPSSGDDDGGL